MQEQSLFFSALCSHAYVDVQQYLTARCFAWGGSGSAGGPCRLSQRRNAMPDGL
jgi:hypothetical protein